MSDWRSVSTVNECDTEGCPSEFALTRRAIDGEKDGDPIPWAEIAEAARALGWRVTDNPPETICPDCIGRGA
jgi:hypothetical protein